MVIFVVFHCFDVGLAVSMVMVVGAYTLVMLMLP